MPIRIRSITIKGFLGAGPSPVSLDFDRAATALCGPNNSGKTTILSAIETAARLVNHLSVGVSVSAPLRPGVHPQGGYVDLVRFSSGRHSDKRITEDLFNRHLPGECAFRLEVGVTRENISFPTEASDNNYPNETFVAANISVSREGTRLTDLALGAKVQIHFDEAGAAEGKYPRAMITEWLSSAQAALSLLQGRLLLFDPFRRFGMPVTQGTDLDAMARGTGLIRWIQLATSPNLRDAASRQSNEFLREFQSEFARFAGFRTLELSVPPEADDLNVFVNGYHVPLSNMGTGIGECLLIMLVTKIAKRMIPQQPAKTVDVIMIEEPELHLHPKLQRALLEYLVGYAKEGETQLILTTHSPSVLNVIKREGGTVYRTGLRPEDGAISAQCANTSDQILELLQSIGSSPGDLLQADKVLWVEGPRDIPVFRAWVRTCPAFANQAIAIVSVGGDDSASDDFDVGQLKVLNPNALVILDSERQVAGGEPSNARKKTLDKCKLAGLKCLLTDLRSTESYFTPSALSSVYSASIKVLDPFRKLKEQMPLFDKEDCGRIAAAMDWADIARTDIGREVENFLRK